ncbi:MAG TPA: DUF4919 domain-containing protein [candidate division Zixibacteria bacterium]|nr:DUF4919 domain-containing protein [candidate division Zixibacteria bacterium]
MRTLRIVLLMTVLGLITSSVAVSAADAASSLQDSEDSPNFKDLWKQVEQADTSVDFTALRMAYTRTSEYDPYDSQRQDLRSDMDAAFNSNDFSTAAELANKLIKRDPLQTDAYIVLDVSYEQMGDTAKSRFHHFVANGLIHSVLSSGNGLSRDSAFRVISTDEEYIILNFLGVDLLRQALVEEKDHSYDVMTVKDASIDSTFDLYFNIDIQMNALKRKLKD